MTSATEKIFRIAAEQRAMIAALLSQGEGAKEYRGSMDAIDACMERALAAADPAVDDVTLAGCTYRPCAEQSVPSHVRWDERVHFAGGANTWSFGDLGRDLGAGSPYLRIFSPAERTTTHYALVTP